MRSTLRLAAAIALALPALAFGQGITNSKHNLAFTSTQTVKASTATDTQLCIFCHTPHKASAQALIWNRAAPVGTRGWTAGTKTVEGTTLPTDISADSRRCLSCHDGTVAIGDVNNKGGGTAGIIAVTGGSGTGDRPRTAYLAGSGSAGNEMVNNHPVSVPYAGATFNTLVSGATADGTLGNYYAVSTTGCTSPSGVCTAQTTNGKAINLKGTGATNAAVECGTCHEPHNQFNLNYLLRVTEAGSALCLACHNK